MPSLLKCAKYALVFAVTMQALVVVAVAVEIWSQNVL